jgi:hypothetical protein
MNNIKDLTQEDFNALPIGQKFIESCCSATTFIKAVKTNEKEIAILSIDAHNFMASYEKVKFNTRFHWLEPVDEFKDVDGKISTFEELLTLFEC